MKVEMQCGIFGITLYQVSPRGTRTRIKTFPLKNYTEAYRAKKRIEKELARKMK